MSGTDLFRYTKGGLLMHMLVPICVCVCVTRKEKKREVGRVRTGVSPVVQLSAPICIKPKAAES